MLARISVDYYLRLEQGRERRPSPQVLDALSDALLLDHDGRLHLYRIAGMTPLPSHEGSTERADPQLLTLAELWDRTPALLLGRAYDVLAANTLGRAVFPHLQPGANVLLTMFLDPSVRSFHADWEKAAANAVAGFRFLEGARPNDPRIHEVLRTASESSREFADLWRRRDARGKSDAAKVLPPPDVGELTLPYADLRRTLRPGAAAGRPPRPGRHPDRGRAPPARLTGGDHPPRTPGRLAEAGHVRARSETMVGVTCVAVLGVGGPTACAAAPDSGRLPGSDEAARRGRRQPPSTATPPPVPAPRPLRRTSPGRGRGAVRPAGAGTSQAAGQGAGSERASVGTQPCVRLRTRVNGDRPTPASAGPVRGGALGAVVPHGPDAGGAAERHGTDHRMVRQGVHRRGARKTQPGAAYGRNSLLGRRPVRGPAVNPRP